MFVVVIVSKGGTPIAHIKFNTRKAAEECKAQIKLWYPDHGHVIIVIEDVRQ